MTHPLPIVSEYQDLPKAPKTGISLSLVSPALMVVEWRSDATMNALCSGTVGVSTPSLAFGGVKLSRPSDGQS